MPLSATKLKVCSVCKREFSPFQSTQKVCSQKCAYQLAVSTREAKEAREARRDIVRRKEALKTLGDWTREAQVEFNKYIRERDYGQPCIACGTTSESQGITGSSWDAGHYRSRGSAPGLRFHLLNVWKVCTRCNRELSGNIVEMRKGMVQRLGEERVIQLECDNRSPKYKVSDLKRIKAIFRRKARLYRKLREQGNVRDKNGAIAHADTD